MLVNVKTTHIIRMIQTKELKPVRTRSCIDYPEGQKWILEMVNNILIEVLGTIAQQERETIHQRQAEGIAAAKRKGKKFGRPRQGTPANWDSVITEWQAGSITAKKAMELTGTKRTTFYKLVKTL